MKKKIFAAICSVTMMAGAAAVAPALGLTASSDALVASADSPTIVASENINGVHWAIGYTNGINSMAGYKIIEAFNYNCMQNVTVPNVVAGYPVNRIGSDIFYGTGTNANHIINLTISSGIYGIEQNFFRDNHSLKYVNFNSDLYWFDDNCFYNATELRTLNIPNQVHTIGSNFCCGATSMTSVNLSDNLEYLGHYAFYGCSNMTSFNCNSAHLTESTDFGHGILWANKWADTILSNPNTVDLKFGYNDSFLYRYVKKLTSNTNITYNNVKYVYDHAFGGDAWNYGNKVRKVYLLNAERIGEYAFKKCPYATVYLTAKKLKASYGSNYKSIVEGRCYPATVVWC